MIGCGNQDGVEVGAIAQVAKIFVDANAFALTRQDVFGRLVPMVAIDVANGGDFNPLVAHEDVEMMSAAEVAGADRTDDYAVARRWSGKNAAGNDGRRRDRRRRRLHELASACWFAHVSNSLVVKTPPRPVRELGPI